MKKTFLIIALILLMVIGLFSLTGCASFEEGVREGLKESSNESIETSSNTTSGNTKINVGGEFSTKDTKITFVSANDYSSYNSYSAPKAGNKIIRAEFSFENISKSDIYLNPLDCYADGEKCEAYYSADDYKNPTLESLSAGKKVKAIVYYEVPTNAENIVLEYDTSVWTNSKVEFIVK